MKYRSITLVFVLSILAACGQDPEPKEDPVIIILDDNNKTNNQTANNQQMESPWVSAENLPDRCIENAAPWDGKQQLFRNRTSNSIFETINVRGVRLSTVDFNHDGYPDLIARRGGAFEDDWSDETTRGFWLLQNQGDGTFEDVTESSGVIARRDDQAKGRPAEVVAWGDVDNDGDLDVVTAFSNKAPLINAAAEVMLNHGDGTFSLGPLAETDFRRPNQIVTTGGLALSDVNRDGNLDLWVGHGGPAQDHLYLGNGKGQFKRITDEAGLVTEEWANVEATNAGGGHTNSWGVNACDLNDDGTPDLLSASYNRAPNHLWLGTIGDNGQPSYANHSVASNYAFDGNQDWSDNLSAQCYCKIDPMGAECMNVPAPTNINCPTDPSNLRWHHPNDRNPWRLGGNTGTTVCADLNNDGLLDLLTTEIVHSDVGGSSDASQLMYNMGEAIFNRVDNTESGLIKTRTNPNSFDDGDITGAALDIDNDGRLDIYIGSTTYDQNRGWLYHQKTNGTFESVLPLLGIDHKSSHGIALADFDRDGDVDVIVGHARGRCNTGNHCYEKDHVRYFENVYAAQKGNWLQIQLAGDLGTNASAIGAKITVEAGNLKLTQEVGGGHGHYGIQHDLVQHFGLGDACEAKITIRWPNKALTTQTLTLKAGYRYRIVQGAPAQVAKSDL